MTGRVRKTYRMRRSRKRNEITTIGVLLKNRNFVFLKTKLGETQGCMINLPLIAPDYKFSDVLSRR